MNKKKITKIFFIIFFILFICLDIVYAKTTSKISFCSYQDVRKTMKVLGLILNIVKIVVPLIIIITGTIGFVKPILSGKNEDLIDNFKIMIKKIIAGFIIFFAPTLINYIFVDLVGYSDDNYTACINCVTDPDSCDTSVEDPDIYE